MTETMTNQVKEEFGGRDGKFWLRVAGIALGALVAVIVVRAIFVTPIDALAVRQVCASHGFEVEHPLESVEQKGEFGVFNRFSATCTYGPSEDDERPAFSKTLDEIDNGGFFTASKYLGLFLQLGTLAAYNRVVVPPFYRKFVSAAKQRR